jgi:hypothetical protein
MTTLHGGMRNISNGAFSGKGILSAVVTHFQGQIAATGTFDLRTNRIHNNLRASVLA